MTLACLILAAGQGTRMRSSKPKVMHAVAGYPMIAHVVHACEMLEASRIVAVIAPGMEEVKACVHPYPCVIQKEPLGTGDAVKAAREELKSFDGNILVLFGDTPLLTVSTLGRLVSRQQETQAAIVVGGFTPEEAGAYGRLVMREDGQLESIVEAADATAEQQKLTLCNGGIMLFQSAKLWPLLDQLRNDNAKKEFYLTDCIALANAQGWK
ncbi:MAG: NTP transferase domain-containing protein, partial [Bdellovibrionales bacterium]